MNLDCTYCSDSKPWQNIKKFIPPGRIHLALLTVNNNDERYDTRKTMLNVVSRLNEKRGIFLVRCQLERISDIVEFAEEVCKNFPHIRYNVVAYRITRERDLFFEVALSSGIYCDKTVISVSDRESLTIQLQERLLQESIAQDVSLLVGDSAFIECADQLKSACRYIIGITSKGKAITNICTRQGVRVINHE